MAGAVEGRDAWTTRVLQPAGAGVTRLPAWLRWGMATAGALGLATAVAPGTPSHPAATKHSTFDASAWFGLTQPLFDAPTPTTTPAPAPSATPVGTGNLPVACTPPAATRTAFSALVPPAVGAPASAVATSAADVVAAPVQAVLTDATSTSTSGTSGTSGTSNTSSNPLGSTLAGVAGLLGGLTGGTGTASTPTGGLQSLLPSLTPSTTSTTTTTTAPPSHTGTTGTTGTSKPSATAPGTPPAPAPAPAALPAVPAPAPTLNSDIGCQLIGTGNVGVVAPGETPAQASAVAAALSLLGTPYVWGGESKHGFDCSGLVQYSYSLAGVGLPRVAQDQYDAGPPVPPGSVVVPGDLVFFGSGPDDVHHVGMFVGDGLMVDAPCTGAVVRLDRIAGFGPVVGVSSPGGRQIA